MLHWALTFFILAIVAALLGLSGVAGTFAWGAKALFVGFIVLTIVFALAGRTSPPA